MTVCRFASSTWAKPPDKSNGAKEKRRMVAHPAPISSCQIGLGLEEPSRAEPEIVLGVPLAELVDVPGVAVFGLQRHPRRQLIAHEADDALVVLEQGRRCASRPVEASRLQRAHAPARAEGELIPGIGRLSVSAVGLRALPAKSKPSKKKPVVPRPSP